MQLTRRDAARLLAPLLLGPGPAAGDDGAWALLEQAREASWGRAGEPPRDYSYDLTTELESQGKRVRLRSKVSLVLPDAFRQEVAGPGNTVLIFDGKQAWRLIAGGRQRLPSEAGRAQASDLARRHVLYAAPPDAAWVRARESQQVSEVETRVIEIVDVGGAPLRLFIDPGALDIVKTLHVGDVPGGGVAQVEELLSDYRDIGGYRWAQQRRILRNGSFASLRTLSNIRINSGLQRADILS